MALGAAADKKAEDPVALDLKGIASFTDSFIILTGNQRRQTQAICDAVVEALADAGVRPGHIEGYDVGDWILIDYSDMVVHVFTPETRSFYKLEGLWGDARQVQPKSRTARKASRGRGAAATRKG